MQANMLRVRICAIEQLTPDIKAFCMRAIDEKALAGFSAGSHVLVSMQHGERVMRNAYSLASSPLQLENYRIAVRIQPQSRGGSVFMHEKVRVGDSLEISPPSNLFPLDRTAMKHVLIAAGVGITPFMSYLPEIKAMGVGHELHYGYRSPRHAAFIDELRCHWGGGLHAYRGDLAQRIDPEKILDGQPLGTHVYVCGPRTLIEETIAVARGLGWPEGHVHWERFASPAPGAAFQAYCARSQREINVAAEVTLLEALEAAGIDVPNLCRGGVCGQCQTELVAGEADHRDSFLTDVDKHGKIMPCVSRARGARLVLNL
ncbi:MAG: oxidoreductase [Betaproteobacteria bacterium]|nr:oxidoreductase [Betaproteobacteria bacterium]